jgi:hypothetical protein
MSFKSNGWLKKIWFLKYDLNWKREKTSFSLKEWDNFEVKLLKNDFYN